MSGPRISFTSRPASAEEIASFLGVTVTLEPDDWSIIANCLWERQKSKRLTLSRRQEIRRVRSAIVEACLPAWTRGRR